MKILIVEDDIALSNGIKSALQNEQTTIKIAHTIKDAKELCITNSFDLIILDINLPDGNGLDFLTWVKKSFSMPVILLTCNDLDSDIVKGLETGADDYITKPFSLAVLRARVNTQLRKNLPFCEFTQDDFRFNFQTHEFYIKDKKLDLSKVEEKLLQILTSNKGVTLDREKLLEKLWSTDENYVEENALSVTIKRLRTKLGNPDCLKTIYGIGYRWE